MEGVGTSTLPPVPAAVTLHEIPVPLPAPIVPEAFSVPRIAAGIKKAVGAIKSNLREGPIWDHPTSPNQRGANSDWIGGEEEGGDAIPPIIEMP